MAQAHVTVIACRNAIRVFKWEDFLYVLSLLFIIIIIRQDQSSLLVYEYTYLSLLANKRSVVERFLQCSLPLGGPVGS